MARAPITVGMRSGGTASAIIDRKLVAASAIGNACRTSNPDRYLGPVGAEDPRHDAINSTKLRCRKLVPRIQRIREPVRTTSRAAGICHSMFMRAGP